MSLHRSQSYPIVAQSSAKSIQSLAEHRNLIREQLLDLRQLCANGLTESSTQTDDSDQSYPIVTKSSATSPSFPQTEPKSIRSFSQAEHGISIQKQLYTISQLCANELADSSTQTGDSVNSMP